MIEFDHRDIISVLDKFLAMYDQLCSGETIDRSVNTWSLNLSNFEYRAIYE